MIYVVSYQDTNKDVKQERVSAKNTEDAYNKVWGRDNVLKIISVRPATSLS